MLDTYEVALILCGLDPDADENFEDEIQEKVDEILYDKYGIEDTDGLDKLIKDLAKMAECAKSPITEEWHRGFSDLKKQMWIYKTKA